MSLFKLLIAGLMISAAAYGIDIKGELYGEFDTQTINKSSNFNKNNLLDKNELKYIMRGNITLKNEFNPNANGLLKLEAEYKPVDFEKKESSDKVYIKEAYIDLLNDLFNARVGKQYIKWGDSLFFNPADVVNVVRDPLKPVNEAEGSPFIQFSIPIQSFASVDILGIIREDETKKAEDIPVAAKLSANVENLSGFTYVMVQENKKPVYGFDANYVFTINQESDISLYTEGCYRSESSKQYIGADGNKNMRNGKSYLGITGGVRYTLKFPSFKRFDSIMVVAEYYHDNENWTKAEYGNMVASLKSTPENGGLYLPFKSAQNYLYLSSSLSNAFLNQMGVGLSAAVNGEDRSGIIMPAITYQYNDYTELGLTGKIFYGKNSSEFGNSIAKNEFGVYTRINF